MKNIITVTQLNSYVKNLFSSDENLSNILVRGEISNFKRHYSGHMYFTLKDENAAISCVMFSSYSSRMGFRPENGMQVTASAYVSLYEKTGSYQLYVTDMKAEGEGALFIKFEKLKKKLASEGLFEEKHKKPLPYLPDKIGVITSASGAVINDIKNVLDRRFPEYHLVLYPSNVQGKGAEKELAAGIKYFNEVYCVDVIIIARGGGSIEDLWPFNEELLAREIYNSQIPVVSAVGHETDFTICDFVSDLRAPTPSAAAELVVPEKILLKENINILSNRISNAVNKSIKLNEDKLKTFSQRPVIKRPMEIFDMAALSLDRMIEKMEVAMNKTYEAKKAEFQEKSGKLSILSPIDTIKRGYAVVTDKEGKVITGVKNLETGDTIKVRMRDGNIGAKVQDKETSDGKEIL